MIVEVLFIKSLLNINYSNQILIQYLIDGVLYI